MNSSIRLLSAAGCLLKDHIRMAVAVNVVALVVDEVVAPADDEAAQAPKAVTRASSLLIAMLNGSEYLRKPRANIRMA
jgi:hypothetical protein